MDEDDNGKFTNPTTCQSLQVVVRGSETQLQVTENCGLRTQHSKKFEGPIF